MESLNSHHSSGVNHKDSPGANCTDPESGGSTANFNADFDWVTYKCESGF